MASETLFLVVAIAAFSTVIYSLAKLLSGISRRKTRRVFSSKV
jgi:hypothetical protein